MYTYCYKSVYVWIHFNATTQTLQCYNTDTSVLQHRHFYTRTCKGESKVRSSKHGCEVGHDLGFEDLTADCALWDMTPCSFLPKHRRFGGTLGRFSQNIGTYAASYTRMNLCSIHCIHCRGNGLFSSPKCPDRLWGYPASI